MDSVAPSTLPTSAPIIVTVRGADLNLVRNVRMRSSFVDILSRSATRMSLFVYSDDAGTENLRFELDGGELLVRDALRFDANARAEDFFTRLLLPTIQYELRGANGSVWKTELRVHNPRDSELAAYAPICSRLLLTPPCLNSTLIRPLWSDQIEAFNEFGDGGFLYLQKDPDHRRIPMTLHVRDLSKNAQSLGTQIPIVRDVDFADLITLVDVPNDPRYRVAVRVYNANEGPRELVMRVYTNISNHLIETRALTLSGNSPRTVFDTSPFPLYPGYAIIDPMSPAVREIGSRVRIEIEDPVRHIVSPPPPPIWAFASVTNNETLQVTTITPHP